jgi:molybdopterin synthase sulfur carrier subunit
MMIRVKYFAALREGLGLGEERWEGVAEDVAALRQALCARGEPYASVLASGVVVRCAVNQELCAPSTPLCEGCEVAFFPPVTGG